MTLLHQREFRNFWFAQSVSLPPSPAPRLRELPEEAA
jgi:hypothetical protein